MSIGEALGLVAAALAALVALVGLLGLAARLVLLPWLRTHLVEPIGEKVTEAAAQWSLAAYMFDQHITRSSEEWGRLWAAIDDLRKEHRHD